jgi:tRNA modification GTPase
VQAELAELLRETLRGLRLNDGLRVAIVGRPNAGKSSLLNALAGSDRAIVNATAGTTRDVLREQLSFDGIVLELADTAGLRETDDDIEREGVRRAHGELHRADVALLVTDAKQADDDLALLSDVPESVEQLVLVNKIDLDSDHPHSEQRDGRRWLWASAKTGEGLETLRDTLKNLAGAGSGEGAFSARRRHVLALQQVDVHLQHTALYLGEQRAGEIAAEELRQAQLALGEITGNYSSDDLLGAIFSSFCIGK